MSKINISYNIKYADEDDPDCQCMLAIDLLFSTSKSSFRFSIDLIENQTCLEKFKKFLNSDEIIFNIIHNEENRQFISFDNKNNWKFFTSLEGQSQGNYEVEYNIECDNMKEHLNAILKKIETTKRTIKHQKYKPGEIVDFPPK